MNEQGMGDIYLCAELFAPLAFPPDLPPVILMDLGVWSGLVSLVDVVVMEWKLWSMNAVVVDEDEKD